MLTFHKLREANESRCARWHPGGINDWSLSDWGLATFGELGEAANIGKKLNRARQRLRGNTEGPEALKARFAEELADTVIYLDLWAASQGVDLAAAIKEKFNLVSEREHFPERL